MEQFIPQSVRLAKAQEFEALKQGSMIVEQYDTQFSQLARFASHILPDERERIKRFIMGLHPSLCQLMGTQMEMYPSYDAMMDTARFMEMVEIEKMIRGRKESEGIILQGNLQCQCIPRLVTEGSVHFTSTMGLHNLLHYHKWSLQMNNAFIKDSFCHTLEMWPTQIAKGFHFLKPKLTLSNPYTISISFT